MPARARVVLLDVACAGAAALVLLGILLASGGIWAHLGGSDLHGMFVPRYEAAARALFREHRLPLWNPWELCGAPLLGSAQGGALYPPVLVAFAVLPRWAALQALYAFHVFVLAWGTIAYLRPHRVGRMPALLVVFVAVAGIFTGAAHAGFDHPNFLGSLAWVPVMLAAWERAVVHGSRPWLGVFAAAYGTQWYVSYPDFPMDVPVLLGLVALATPVATWRRRLGMLLGGGVLGGLLGATQILPIADAVTESVRANTGAAFEALRSGFDAPLARMLASLPVRMGVGALALAAVGMITGGRIVVGWSLALVWALFALKPPFVWLYGLPPYSGARFPLGWESVMPLFVGFLAAAGLAAGLRARRRVPRLASLGLGLVAAAGALAVIHRAPSTMSRLSAGAVELDYDRLAERAAEIAGGLRRGGPRFVSSLDLTMGTPLRHRLRAAGGYYPSVPPRRIGRLLDEAGIGTVGRPNWFAMGRHPRLLDRLGVGTVLMPTHLTGAFRRRGWVLVAEMGDEAVLLARAALPRARIVHSIRRVATADEAFALVTDPATDPLRLAILEAGDPVPNLASAPPGATHARILRENPEYVEIDAMSPSPGLLVLADTYAPGWRVRVDGTPATLVHADYAFRGVALPAGRHRVTFRYRPASVVVGLALTAAATLVVAWLLLGGAWTEDRRPADAGAAQ